MTPATPAVLILAPPQGYLKAGLDAVLGAERCAALEADLLSRTQAWAEQAAPGCVQVAPAPEEAGALIAGGASPVLIVRPVVPRLGRAHATAALGDLAEGCDLVVGPTIDGGFYLVGMRSWHPELFELAGAGGADGDVMTAGAALAKEAGLELGILRAERPLQRPADLRAALADPLLPAALARILRPAG